MGVWVWIALAVAAMGILFLAFAGILAASKKDADVRRDAHGNIILLDTPNRRVGAASAYDSNIEMELRGHKMSDGMSWNEVWLNTIRNIRRSTENPEWYVQYIIEQRRKAGLPELEGVDEAR
ncbi:MULTISPECIES: hypothetical protein [Cohnella]|uniref:hypothetical protein n=1 Tax=Cohnella TaxID=329857 RepID=UPI0009BA5DF3|nr:MULTISPECIES: hypothetical protein [Cohnella]MBN2981034.1 hypothetical protein [Cohnella algarum]